MNRSFQKKKVKAFAFSAFAFSFCILFFQNCGKGFQAGSFLEGTSSFSSGAPAFTINIPAVRASKLSQTPYFRQYNKTNIANFKRFEPQYALYSDESTKRRWIYLPDQTQVNTQNLDGWIFPQGTILWKEFSIDNRRVETRVLEKIAAGNGPSAWRASVYLWKTDQSDADLLDPSETNFYAKPLTEREIYEASSVENRYKIVHNNACMNCHMGSADVSLGFNYLQLSSTKIVNIGTLRDENKLSHPPMVYDDLPGTPAQKAGLGYIQANCAHCHNGRPGVPHNFKHFANNERYTDEPAVMAANNRAGLIVAGDPSSSILYNRFLGQPITPGGADLPRMPQLGSAIIDPVGQAILNDWIMGFND